MRRRLRKKLHVGEFQELGFLVRAELVAELKDADFDAFLDRLIELVEARRMMLGGGGTRNFEAFIAYAGRGTTSEADRSALDLFLKTDPAVTRYEVGPLVDAWHGPHT